MRKEEKRLRRTLDDIEDRLPNAEAKKHLQDALDTIEIVSSDSELGDCSEARRVHKALLESQAVQEELQHWNNRELRYSKHATSARKTRPRADIRETVARDGIIATPTEDF